MKTTLKRSLLGAFIITIQLSCHNLWAQAPPLPFEFAICQDFFGMVENGNLTEVNSCLQKKPELIQKRNLNGKTPLMTAAEAGQVKMVAYLLENGAFVDEVNSKGEMAIHLAAKTGNLETVMELIDHGADFLSKTNEGNSPLHYAAASGNTELVSYFEKLEISFYF
jgi:ankyrin repeat protein